MKVRRSKKVMENYVCPVCWHQLQDCECEMYPPWSLTMIDVNMQEIVRILNRKGYQTISCCESHWNDNHSVYVSFPMDYHFEIPEGFASVKRNTSVCYMYKKADNKDKETFEGVKAEKLRILLEWAKTLPENPSLFRR